MFLNLTLVIDHYVTFRITESFNCNQFSSPFKAVSLYVQYNKPGGYWANAGGVVRFSYKHDKGFTASSNVRYTYFNRALCFKALNLIINFKMLALLKGTIYEQPA